MLSQAGGFFATREAVCACRDGVSDVWSSAASGGVTGWALVSITQGYRRAPLGAAVLAATGAAGHLAFEQFEQWRSRRADEIIAERAAHIRAIGADIAAR